MTSLIDPVLVLILTEGLTIPAAVAISGPPGTSGLLALDRMD
jgi:hypothetical protein